MERLHLHILDSWIIFIYLVAMVLIGFYYSRKNKTVDEFTRASGKIPSWALGLSMYATFLSSNTFLGVPGKAYGANWNYFVFSLSMPVAAWIAVKYFIPFYRSSREISAYTHFEHRFGAWARNYAVICFLLTQLARMGSVFFGIALTLQAITGYSMQSIIVVAGAVIILYTVMGGMKAVIWTEVLQAFVKTFGALLILYFIIRSMPGGMAHIFSIARAHDKLSLGTFRPDFHSSSFWVIFLYGLFINLSNFGTDQNYVQRYHATGSVREAAQSVWLCVKMYIPVSLIFFVIGTALYAWYQVHPELLEVVKLRVAMERLPAGASAQAMSQVAATLRPEEYGDKMLPDFMAIALPLGTVGLIVSAILAAAMSTVSSGMNAAGTVFTLDIYRRYISRAQGKKNDTLRVLMLATVGVGLLAVLSGLAMIGVKSILDLWWQLSGIFSAGMLGLFLLSIVSRRTKNREALLATIIGVLVIARLSIGAILPAAPAFLQSVINVNMTIVIGTLSIFGMGIGLAMLRSGRRPVAD